MFIILFPLVAVLTAVYLIVSLHSMIRARRVQELSRLIFSLSDLCGHSDGDAIFQEMCEMSMIYDIRPAEIGCADQGEWRFKALVSMRLYRKRISRRYRESYGRFKELMDRTHWSPDESKEFKGLRATVMRVGSEFNAFCRQLDRFERDSLNILR